MILVNPVRVVILKGGEFYISYPHLISPATKIIVMEIVPLQFSFFHHDTYCSTKRPSLFKIREIVTKESNPLEGTPLTREAQTFLFPPSLSSGIHLQSWTNTRFHSGLVYVEYPISLVVNLLRTD